MKGSCCIVCLLNVITSVSCKLESHVETNQRRLNDLQRLGAASAEGIWVPADHNLRPTPLYGIQDCPCMYPEKVCDKLGWYAQLVNQIPNSDGSKTWHVMCASPEVTQRQHFAWLAAGLDEVAWQDARSIFSAIQCNDNNGHRSSACWQNQGSQETRN